MRISRLSWDGLVIFVKLSSVLFLCDGLHMVVFCDGLRAMISCDGFYVMFS